MRLVIASITPIPKIQMGMIMAVAGSMVVPARRPMLPGTTTIHRLSGTPSQ